MYVKQFLPGYNYNVLRQIWYLLCIKTEYTFSGTFLPL